MQKESGKNNWVGVVIIFALFVLLFFVVSGKKRDIVTVPPPVNSKGLADLPLFAGGLVAAGINAETIGFHSFSSDGKYFFMSVFSPVANPPNRAYLVTLKDGSISPLPGLIEHGITDNRVVQLYHPTGIILHWIETGKETTYAVGKNVFQGTLSPGGEVYVVNTSEGIKKIDIATGTITSFSQAQYDGAYAWFSDGKRMLGFKETDERLGEGAGKAQTTGVWDISSGTFTPLPVTIAQKKIRMIEWIIPDTIARINAGWDDGSHDYLLAVATDKLTDVGDTSGALMATATDRTKGLFALVESDGFSPVRGPRVVLYKGAQKLHDFELPVHNYVRKNLNIVNADYAIYLREERSSDGDHTATEVVSLNFLTKEETVLHLVPVRSTFTALSLSPDKKTWVLSSGAAFLTGTIK